jgi:hypothetical protein
MPELDRAWSIQLKKAIGARYKQCYKNAFTVVWRRCDDLAEKWPDLKGAWYVEGVVVTEHDVGLSHAWVETAGGVILDPTLAIDHRFPVVHFAGNRYTSGEIRHLVARQHNTGPIDYGNTPGMRRAYQAMHEAYPASRPKPVDTAESRQTITAYLERNGKSPNEIQRQLSLLGLLPASGEPDA